MPPKRERTSTTPEERANELLDDSFDRKDLVSRELKKSEAKADIIKRLVGGKSGEELVQVVLDMFNKGRAGGKDMLIAYCDKWGIVRPKTGTSEDLVRSILGVADRSVKPRTADPPAAAAAAAPAAPAAAPAIGGLFTNPPLAAALASPAPAAAAAAAKGKPKAAPSSSSSSSAAAAGAAGSISSNGSSGGGAGAKASGGAANGAAAAKPERKRSAFINFYVQNFETVREQLRSLLGRDPGINEVSREAGHRWSLLSQDQKASYRTGAAREEDAAPEVRTLEQCGVALRSALDQLRRVPGGQGLVQSLHARLLGLVADLRVYGTPQEHTVSFNGRANPQVAAFIFEVFNEQLGDFFGAILDEKTQDVTVTSRAMSIREWEDLIRVAFRETWCN